MTVSDIYTVTDGNVECILHHEAKTVNKIPVFAIPEYYMDLIVNKIYIREGVLILCVI